MIIGATPRLRQIVVEVWRPLTILFVWDVAVTAFHFLSPLREPPLPTALFGTALALFLGFRTNAAYARWWEARTLWGALINASRSLARLALSLTRRGSEEDLALRDAAVVRQIAFAQALRCQLRGEDPRAEIARLAGEDLATRAATRRSPANALLESISGRFADALDAGRINPIQQSLVEQTLTDVANAQGGMERIKNTPLPNGFRFFPNLFTRVFCVLLPIALVETLGLATPIGSTLIGLVFLAVLSIGEDLTDPFADSVHDVPLSAMCRTIEIDLLQSIGREAPPVLQPVDGVLS
jgi:putative membrane protein